SGKECVPRSRSSSRARDSSASCSSKRDVSTMADAPDSSMRTIFSTDSDMGVDDTTMGPFSLRPRYVVEKSIILRLRRLPGASSLPACHFVLEERCGESRRVQALRPEQSTHATDARRHPVLLSATRPPARDSRGPAWCNALRDTHTPSAGLTAPWNRAGTDFCPVREGPGYSASAANSLTAQPASAVRAHAPGRSRVQYNWRTR